MDLLDAVDASDVARVSNDLLDAVNWSSVGGTDVGITFVFRKQSDDDFKYAYQGEFQAQLEGNHGYELQFLPDPPSRSYVPVRAWSKKGMEQDVLEAISGRTVARHLLKRMTPHFLNRLVKRLGLR